MKTVRVRVFVSVSPTGEWEAAGSSYAVDEFHIRKCGHDPNIDRGHWLEASVPLPNQAPEIVATVTRAE